MGDTGEGQTPTDLPKVELQTETVFDDIRKLEARIIKIENHIGIKNGTCTH